MPLVTITCSEGFYPLDINPIRGSAEIMPSTGEEGVINLTQALPRLIVENAADLGLNPDHTTEGGVQVDIKKFHGCAVNTVDLWIQIQFVEPYPGKVMAIVARETFVDMLTKQLHDRLGRYQIAFSSAIDMFWGPGHGCIVPSSPNRGRIHW